MARIPLEIGEWGRVRRLSTPHGPAARAYFRDSRGVRVPVQRRGDSPAAAERNLVKALKEMAKAASGDGVITADSTIADLAEYYFDEIESDGAKDGTVTTYKSNYTRHIKSEIGNVKLRQITVARLEQVIRAHRDRPATAKGIRVVLVNMFNVAVRHDAVRVNYAANTKPVLVASKKVKALAPEQVKELLKTVETAARDHDKDMIAPVKLLAATGCRTGELLALRWQDLDLDTGVLRVTGTMVLDSETGKLKRQDEGKSLAASRGLTLPPTVVELLRARYEMSEGEVLFPSRAGTYQWPHNFRRKWRDVLRGTEFEGTTPRDFRKAVATYLDRALGSAAAQIQLGHESDQITTTYYIERAEQVADFSALLDELVSK